MKKLVGLTGTTGAGKSTISKYLQEKGAYIIDGDVVARQVLVEDKCLLPRLCEAFGDILNADGTLDRRALAREAFSTPEKTALLNSLMHPAINDFIHKQAEAAFEKCNVVVVDAAAIIESGFADECDAMIVVHAPAEVRKARIMARDNMSEKDALVRINGQKDDDFYLSRADYVVRAYEPFDYKEELVPVVKELFG
jgi:dephospho-CoA kinase